MKKSFFLLIVMGLVGGLLQAQGVPAAEGADLLEAEPVVAETEQVPPLANAADPADEGFVAPRETMQTENAPVKTPKVLYNPKVRRDPTLSPDDVLILEDRARRLRIAQENERKRKELEAQREAERKERERQRQILLLRYPELEVKNKIRIGGVIGNEVFFGNNANKMYTAGRTISVRGESGEMRQVKIEAITAESVVFSYKGRRFSKKI